MTLALSLSLLLVLGCASGLSLREGLIDLEAAAPQHVRGMLTGAFYAVTYIGFGLPLLLTSVGIWRLAHHSRRDGAARGGGRDQPDGTATAR